MKTKSWIIGGIAAIAVIVALTAGFAWSGIYNVGADDQHTRPVYALLDTMRERSIVVRANDLQPPGDLAEPERIRQGAGNYNAMCMGCHLAPGMDETELSRGLNPSPPNLSKATVDASVAFWVIKHGIKASGMPAWGESMGDEYIWNMAAFLQELPKMDAAQYQAMVASSGGHDHGGGETIEHAYAESTAPDHHGGAADEHAGMQMGAAVTDHAHPPGVPDDHDDDAAPERSAEPATVTHRHADGTVESHPAPAAAKSMNGAHDDAHVDPATPAPEPAVPETHDDHQH